jgi:two-component system cell cycle sensor histidine kinase/response regulator CckA
MHKSLKKRLTITFLVLAVGPLFLVGLILTARTYTVEKHNAVALQREVARHLSARVIGFIEDLERVLETVLQIHNFHRLDSQQQKTILSIIHARQPAFDELIFLDDAGREKIYFSRLEVYHDATPGQQKNSDAFRIPMSQGVTYYGPVRFKAATGEPLMTLGLPINNLVTGKSDGVIVADVRIKDIWNLVSRICPGPKGNSYIVDSKNRVVAHRNPSVVLRGTQFDPPNQDGIHSGLNGKKAVLVSEEVDLGDQRFSIVVENPISDALALAFETIWVIAFALAVLSGVAGALGVMAMRRIVHPIQDLADVARQIQAGRLTKQATISAQDEIGELAEAFNSMMRKLTDSMETLRIEIIERKRAEAALREAYSIINRSPAVTFLWRNAEGWPVELVSDNVKGVFGYTAEEFTSGKISYATTIHPDDLERVAQEVSTYSEEGRVDFVHTPYRIITKDGETKWLDDMTFIRRDEKGSITHYEGIVLDVSERVKAKEETESLQEKLQRSQKMESLGLLAGGVAHDLNNVLAGIVSYPELLLMDLPEDSKLRKPIKTIEQSGRRAVSIVQDLLTIARGVATTKEPLNLNDLIKDYLESPECKKLEQYYPAVTIETNLDGTLLNVNGSHVHLRKVVMNLVSNASEAIEGRGKVTISTMNRYVDRPLKLYDDVKIGEYAVLSVSDDGPGISSVDLERIFEPFYSKKAMGRSGTGLGLAVVWNVIKEHEGYINVTSDKDGTTFDLYFPITREEVLDKALVIPIENIKGKGEKILVVDDIDSQREITCNILEKLDYKAGSVSSGEEAVEYIKKHSVDLILLDMIMDPGINGRETYEKIIKIHPGQKAIIVSGFAETDEVRAAQKLGAGQYIRKPLTLQKVGLAVKEELEKS